MKIAVTGSTGHLGTLVIRMLKEKMPAENIIALARTPEKASGFGVEVRKADYEQPDTLNKALEGVDTLLFISASEIGKRISQHISILNAAKANNVKWIIYTSLLHAENSIISLAAEHRSTEQAIKDSGIPYTILRNGWYTENYTASVPNALGAGAFIGSAGDGKMSLATRRDYAEAAVAVSTSGDHKGKTYELAGDEAYTLHDLAAEVSRQSGKNIPYKNLPETEYAQILKGFGLPDAVASAIAGWDVAASKGALYDDSHQLSKLIGRPTTPLSTSVSEMLPASTNVL